MSSQPDYISCIACHKALLYQLFEPNIAISFELPFCDNKECNRYRLFTMPLESDYV